MIRRWRFILLYLLLGGTTAFIHLHETRAVPPVRSFSEFPVTHGKWRMVDQERFSESVLKVLKATDYLSRRYVGPDGVPVALYVGYYDGAEGTGGIHSPRHCLPGSGWLRLSDRRVDIELGGRRLPMVEAVYEKDGEKNLFLYAFQVRDRLLSDEYSLKLAEIAGSVLEKRKDSAFLRVSVPFDGDETRASAAARRFMADFFPVIQDFIPR